MTANSVLQALLVVWGKTFDAGSGVDTSGICTVVVLKTDFIYLIIPT
mgnify:CR=1 FL=1